MDYFYKITDGGKIAVDDTILVKDAPCGAGSRILEGFKPLFSAEAVTRLEDKGYKISGKAHVGEFGLDLVGEFSNYNTQTGTLKGALAEAVLSGEVKAGLGVDMNGSPRRSAAQSGILFLKPTYGTVSRYGIVSCAASGEQMGVYAKNSKDIAEIMEIISGHDSKDGTSLPDENYDYSLGKDISKMKVCIIKELYDMADEDVRKEIDSFISSLKNKGGQIEEISSSIFETANTAWQILMCAETCNNVSRYDGVKYGHRAKEYKNIDELYVNSRTEGFNFLTKAVILYGSDVLSKQRYEDCYDKSLKVRRVVKEQIEKILSSYDAIITPVCKKSSYESYDIKDAFEKVYKESVFTSVANLIGIPALSVGKTQLLGKIFDESTLLSLAHSAERKGE